MTLIICKIVISMYWFFNLPCSCFGYVFFGNWSMTAMKSEEGMRVYSSWIQLWSMSYLEYNDTMYNLWLWCWYLLFLILNPRLLDWLWRMHVYYDMIILWLTIVCHDYNSVWVKGLHTCLWILKWNSRIVLTYEYHELLWWNFHIGV